MSNSAILSVAIIVQIVEVTAEIKYKIKTCPIISDTQVLLVWYEQKWEFVVFEATSLKWQTLSAPASSFTFGRPLQVAAILPIYLFVTENPPRCPSKIDNFSALFLKSKVKRFFSVWDRVAGNCYWGPFQRSCLLSISSSLSFLFGLKSVRFPNLKKHRKNLRMLSSVTLNR